MWSSGHIVRNTSWVAGFVIFNGQTIGDCDVQAVCILLEINTSSYSKFWFGVDSVTRFFATICLFTLPDSDSQKVRVLCLSNGVFTLPDTDTYTDTDKMGM